MKEKQMLPKHIAIIMDGNRRWARERGLPPVAGHQFVADSVLELLIEHAADVGIEYLTFWAFSTENWKRDPVEVSAIMHIFKNALVKMGKRMHEKGVRIRAIGNLAKFSQDIQSSVNNLIELTKHNTRITVIFALNYGGRDEIVRAIRSMIHDSGLVIQRKNNVQNIFTQYLDTVGIPDPEFIIRTGGEQRLSGFLLWQSEYSELYFPSWYMPEFMPQKLDEAIAEYAKRQRRFGK